MKNSFLNKLISWTVILCLTGSNLSWASGGEWQVLSPPSEMHRENLPERISLQSPPDQDQVAPVKKRVISGRMLALVGSFLGEISLGFSLPWMNIILPFLLMLMSGTY